ncbi:MULTISPECIES: helix-turn-helix transcriptional regulator [Enterobacteriaceae]|uniref:helix-turn-helix transcriptional regulator n=1 Tax=Enterobacteriaceae TaxID=543 RepID=UPI00093062B2|nr:MULTISPECIES: AlpA family transcriptional regulator [Enterobacteriaceae]MDD8599723.1 AlpA family transcriptional regulator [Escherichia coli]MBA7744758.1 AlpA family transcriptional regulator [Enterobacter roggenkampii]MBJ6455175.1 AlpA family transcriptional regulator [Enterobacter hormaechei]MBK4623931.1 AlpA family transcriptional regulator [Enterobacter hormaechei]MBK4642945.1 AlpA family transcriptional regulator [Enterobacter hormaechei]
MPNQRLIKVKTVLELCAISRATLYRLIEANAFPRQVSLTGARAVAWREEEVLEWINSRTKIPSNLY